MVGLTSQLYKRSVCSSVQDSISRHLPNRTMKCLQGPDIMIFVASTECVYRKKVDGLPNAHELIVCAPSDLSFGFCQMKGVVGNQEMEESILGPPHRIFSVTASQCSNRHRLRAIWSRVQIPGENDLARKKMRVVKSAPAEFHVRGSIWGVGSTREGVLKSIYDATTKATRYW